MTDMIFDPATAELDIGSWFVTRPTHPELSQAGSLKQGYKVNTFLFHFISHVGEL